MSLFPHASVTHLLLETALIVVVADSLVAIAALAAAACLKRNPAAAHCVLAFALAWIFVVPLGALARAVSGVSIVSLPGPAETLVSALEPTLLAEAVGVEDTSNPTPTPESAKALPRYTPSPNRPRLAAESAAPIQASAAREIPRTTGLTLTEPHAQRHGGASDARPSRLGAGIVTASGAFIGAVWLMGVLFLLIRTLRSYARMRAIRRTLTVLPEESFGPVLDDVRRRLNLVRLPEIAASDRVWTPCVLGLFRPVIALPADALRNIGARQLGDVLVHEGAHVVRHDCVMALIQKIAGSLFWPHPLIHWLNRRLTSVREEVCDNYVLADTDAVSYGETLFQFAQIVGRRRPVPAAVGMLHGSGRLEQRIAGLIDDRRNRHTRTGNFSRALALVAFGSLFVLACGGRGHSEEPPEIERKIGRADRATYSDVQTPPPKTSASQPATAAPDRSVSMKVKRHRKDRRPLSKAEIDSVQLVPGRAHTLHVPEEIRVKLGIRRDNVDQLAIAKRVVRIPPLVLEGTTALDPNAAFRLRPFPASASGTTVVEIGKVATQPRPGEKGPAEREIRSGDRVHKGELLVALYSGEVANTKNDLIDALSQLKIDKEILKRQQAEAKDMVGTTVLLLTARRNVQADQNAANRAMRTLRGWGISGKEIQAVLAQAEKPKTSDEQSLGTPGLEWGRIELRSPFDGVVLERNVALHEVIVDRDATLFRVASLDRLLVHAELPEYNLAALQAVGPHPAWTIEFGGGRTADGFIEEIGTRPEPKPQTGTTILNGNQPGTIIFNDFLSGAPTVSLKGDVENKQRLLRAGQSVKIRIPLPIEGVVVEVPGNCIIASDDAMVVFVQTDPAKAEYTAQRVNQVSWFNNRRFLWSKPIVNGVDTPAAEAVQERIPLKPVTEGTRLVQNGVDELWRILKQREAMQKP